MFSLDVSGLVGIITAGIVEVLKRIPAVPLVAGQTKRIRIVAAALSFLGTLGTAIAMNDLTAMNLVAGTITSFLVSYLAYKGVIADPNKAPAQ
jgi:hypothetical protein